MAHFTWSITPSRPFETSGLFLDKEETFASQLAEESEGAPGIYRAAATAKKAAKLTVELLEDDNEQGDKAGKPINFKIRIYELKEI